MYKDCWAKIGVNIRRRWPDQVYIIPRASAPGFNAWQPWLGNFQLQSNGWNYICDHTLSVAWIDDSWRK